MSGYVKKLGSDKSYVRPKVTLQEKLTAQDIADKLEGYERVEDISEVPLNTHLRYFVVHPDGKQEFRLGGFLHRKDNADEYVMMSNGKQSWSVQTKTAVFYRKLSQKEIVDMYEEKLREKDETIKKLKSWIRKRINEEKLIKKAAK